MPFCALSINTKRNVIQLRCYHWLWKELNQFFHSTPKRNRETKSGQRGQLETTDSGRTRVVVAFHIVVLKLLKNKTPAPTCLWTSLFSLREFPNTQNWKTRHDFFFHWGLNSLWNTLRQSDDAVSVANENIITTVPFFPNKCPIFFSAGNYTRKRRQRKENGKIIAAGAAICEISVKCRRPKQKYRTHTHENVNKKNLF